MDDLSDFYNVLSSDQENFISLTDRIFSKEEIDASVRGQLDEFDDKRVTLEENEQFGFLGINEMILFEKAAVFDYQEIWVQIQYMISTSNPLREERYKIYDSIMKKNSDSVPTYMPQIKIFDAILEYAGVFERIPLTETEPLANYIVAYAKMRIDFVHNNDYKTLENSYNRLPEHGTFRKLAQIVSHEILAHDVSKKMFTGLAFKKNRQYKNILDTPITEGKSNERVRVDKLPADPGANKFSERYLDCNTLTSHDEKTDYLTHEGRFLLAVNLAMKELRSVAPVPDINELGEITYIHGM
ncbi:MAG: hypothetical protein KKF44_05010 [Nanoarchaeota archaeon]|nr:hypothetical protein [Nanoarchaeota archaeon]